MTADVRDLVQASGRVMLVLWAQTSISLSNIVKNLDTVDMVILPFLQFLNKACNMGYGNLVE